MSKLKIAKFERYDMLNNPQSDGPAFTIWFSGCTARCPGCHNKALWDDKLGDSFTADEVGDIIDRDVANGPKYRDVVLLGGEPLEQDEAQLEDLVRSLVNEGYRIWLYTGWEFEDVPKFYIDNCYFIKVGRYMEEHKTFDFPASSNQHIYKRKNGKLVKIK